MKALRLAVLGFVVALCLASCAQQHMAQILQPNKDGCVQVAVIATEVGHQAELVLQRAGVQCIVEAGSGEAAYFSGVWVSKSAKHRAITLLRADPVVDKSMPFVFE